MKETWQFVIILEHLLQLFRHRSLKFFKGENTLGRMDFDTKENFDDGPTKRK